MRIFLGLLSVITEATLVVALSRKYGKRLGSYTLAMLCLTSGCFFASTSAYASFDAILFLVFYSITFPFLDKMVLSVTLIVYIFLQVSCQVHFLCMLFLSHQHYIFLTDRQWQLQ